MNMEPTPSLADRFTRFIERLCAVIGVYAGVFPWAGPLVSAAQGRVRRLGERFALLATRASGRKFSRARRQGMTREVTAVRPRPAIFLPTIPWLMQAVGAALHCGEPLKRLLDDPEMAQLVAAAPQAGRILRPLCRMLRVKRPAYLRTARRAAAQAEVPLGAGDSAQTDCSSTPSPDHLPQNDVAPAEPPGAAPPLPPPAPTRSKAEEDAIAHARRTGGLYFDGTRMRWS